MSYLLPSRAQPLDHARELVQAGIRFLEQAVNDINHSPPIALDGVYVWQLWTYNLRARSRIAEKAFRKTQKSRILAVDRRGYGRVD